MDEFPQTLKTVQSITMFFLSFCLVGWAVLVDYRPYFAGLLIGTCASLINSRHLGWKITKLTKVALDNSGRKVNMGFLTRAAIAALAVVVSIRYEQFAFSTALAGLFFTQLATLVLGIISARKTNK
jgi:ATP synthase protein I